MGAATADEKRAATDKAVQSYTIAAPAFSGRISAQIPPPPASATDNGKPGIAETDGQRNGNTPGRPLPVNAAVLA